MKILLVTDQFYQANNGLTISSRRFAQVLEQHGNEVRVASYGRKEDVPEGKTAYLMEKQYIPVFDGLVSSQGMTFAKPDDELLSKAIAWADVVHFLSPFATAHHGIMLARRMGKPYTAAFHVQPENITSSIHMQHMRPVNSGIYHWFNHYIYRYCDYIHCPSRFIADQLVSHGYRGRIYVISNGIDPDFRYRKLEKPEELRDKFVILMIGRLSVEKRQDVLINAIMQSKYSDRIQLVLAGQGPRRQRIERMAQKLTNPVRIEFFDKQGLLDIIAQSDLYVHAAEAEIEAMSCMEAFAGGLVPVIANSKKSATPQFAVDERSLFRTGDSTDLARKIDYFIEHPDERRELEHKYSELAEKYRLDDCVRKAEEMFEDAVNEQRKRVK
jgi:1,2-diacylglycerol 3-alpha-glucosyltransferase